MWRSLIGSSGWGKAQLRGGFLLGVLLILNACAGPSVEAIRADLKAGRSPGAFIADVPFIAQREYYCGPASLAMVLQFWGESVGQDEIASELFIESIKGTLNFDLEFYARRRGFRAESFRGTLDSLKAEIARGRPLIVFLDLGAGPFTFPHFAVVTGYDESRRLVIAHSGTTANRLIPYWEFERTWAAKGNWTLLITPKSPARSLKDRKRKETGYGTSTHFSGEAPK